MNNPANPLPTDLPPPPAPVARDANPWHWPQAADERSRSRRPKAPNPKLEQIRRLRQSRDEVAATPPTGPVVATGAAQRQSAATVSPSPAAAVPAAPSTTTQRKREGRGGLAAIVPFGMFLVAIGVVASGALDALRDGAGIGAFVPLLVFALIFGLGALRRARRGDRQ